MIIGTATAVNPASRMGLRKDIRLEASRAAVRRMSRAARRLAEEKYTWDHQAAIVESVLESVVK